MSMKNSIGNRTRYHLFSSAVSQPTALHRARKYQVLAINNEPPASENVEIPLKHGSPTFLWQRAKPVVVGWIVGRTSNNNNDW